LFWIDLGTTLVFLLECIMKIVAFGFMTNGRSSYLRQPWNILDFTIIFFSVLSLTPLSDNLRTFKIFRILRLLRLISRNEELKVAVRALFLAIPNVANVTIIMLLFFLIFGVIAVSYFKGKLYYCSPPLPELVPLLVHKWDCLDAGGEWINQIYTFDNSINALITLFVMATTAGWADVMMQCAKSTSIDYLPGGPETASPGWIFFFIVFIIVGAFFFLNLFVGVVISTFNSEHDKLGGNDLLTEKQKEWIDLRLLVLRSAPERRL
jgi:voltage-dependent calcium channel L type alpha-1D